MTDRQTDRQTDEKKKNSEDIKTNENVLYMETCGYLYVYSVYKSNPLRHRELMTFSHFLFLDPKRENNYQSCQWTIC